MSPMVRAKGPKKRPVLEERSITVILRYRVEYEGVKYPAGEQDVPAHVADFLLAGKMADLPPEEEEQTNDG